MIVTRFAPSPTGLLHLGHARAASVAHRLARTTGGRFLLRIEDIDPGRCRPDFEAALRDDLAWLGLHWTGPVRRQSEHTDAYRAALDRLRALGLAYRCFCSRADIAAAVAAPHGPHAGPGADPYGAPLYPGTCRARADAAALRAQGHPHAWRLDMGRAIALAGPLAFHDRIHGRIACAPARFGDVVLARRDAPASYLLCVTHDDACQGVSLVTRGDDLLAATDLQRLLQSLLGWPAPDYLHHPLVTGPDGRRLAKRDPSATIQALRRQGLSPRQVLDLAAWTPDGVSPPPAAMPRAPHPAGPTHPER